MKLKSSLSFFTIFISVLLLNGCATSRSIIDIPLPASEKISQPNGKEIYINSVIDQRVFQIKPPEPNIPSLDPSEDGGEKIKLRAIARKRNSYGMGLGDILLPEGKTVESIINSTLRQAFIENGYNVIKSKEQITDKTYIVDARINKFWSWMNPGFWAITLSTEISTDIALKNKDGIDEKTIAIRASDTFQSGAEDNCVEVMQNAIKQYVAELKLKYKSNVSSSSAIKLSPVFTENNTSVNKTAAPIAFTTKAVEKPKITSATAINSKLIEKIQTALTSDHYYHGAINGELNEDTRNAIAVYKEINNLSGKSIDKAFLNALWIAE